MSPAQKELTRACTVAALSDLAPVVMSMGDLAEAERVGRRWLELADDIPHRRSALEALTYLARVLMEQERDAEAEPLCQVV